MRHPSALSTCSCPLRPICAVCGLQPPCAALSALLTRPSRLPHALSLRHMHLPPPSTCRTRPTPPFRTLCRLSAPSTHCPRHPPPSPLPPRTVSVPSTPSATLHALHTPSAASSRPLHAVHALHAPSAACMRRPLPPRTLDAPLVPSAASTCPPPPSPPSPPPPRALDAPSAASDHPVPPSPWPPHAARALYTLHVLSAHRPCAHRGLQVPSPRCTCPLCAVRHLLVPYPPSDRLYLILRV
ncbi:hypothetical protein DENSPDRAFT_886259 [Dentipellis sp. KUC8613]|nr:hypothetical protein DENSPDRAFT_886259 [Dentipellis sp. KUC8613]